MTAHPHPHPPSPEHPNALRVRELFAAFRRGDVAAVSAVFSDDAVWHFPGRRGALAGSHRGRAAILRFLARVVELTRGSFHLELEDVLANDRAAVAFFRGHAERDGRRLDNPTCLRMRLDGIHVVELHEFVWDLEHVEEFWS
jgi:hypothetical protein